MSGTPSIRRREFVGGSGNRIAADEAGPDDAVPVLLLHGGGQTRHSWRRALVEIAEAGYHAVALDTRGHGDSEWAPDGDYSIDRLVGDVEAVARSLGSPPVLVGASMGGTTSIISASDRPGLARAIVLVDVAARVESAGVKRIADFMGARPDGFANLDEAADAVAAYNPARPRPSDTSGLAKNLRLGADGRWRWHWDPRFLQRPNQLGATVTLMNERMADAARKVKIPTLLVRGGQSDVVSEQGVAEMRDYMPHLEFVDIPGAAHMVSGDRNDPFNAAVLDFLARRVPLASAS